MFMLMHVINFESFLNHFLVNVIYSPCICYQNLSLFSEFDLLCLFIDLPMLYDIKGDNCSYCFS